MKPKLKLRNSMTAILSQTSPDKLVRHRAARVASGLRLKQLWVPDTRRLGLVEDIARQCALASAQPSERAAIGFAEAAAASVEGWQ
jgi:hypothetical protein